MINSPKFTEAGSHSSYTEGKELMDRSPKKEKINKLDKEYVCGSVHQWPLIPQALAWSANP